MANISIIARSGATTSTVSGETASVISPSIVKLNINPRDVAGLERNGNDLVITLKDGEKVTIENYFVVDAEGNGSELVFEDQNGALWWVEEPAAGLHFAPLQDIDTLLITQSSTEGAMPWIFGALGVGAGMVAAAASIGSSGNHHHSADSESSGDPGSDPNGNPGTNPGTDPGTDPGPGTTTPPESGPNQVDNVSEMTITDNVEQNIGPVAKGGFTNDNTPTLSGVALANATVTIYDGETLLGSVKADAKGAWSFTTGVLSDGVHSFTTTVSKGDVSSGKSGAYVVTIDTHAPGAVTLVIATDNQSPVLGTISAGETTNDNTPVISGKAEPGSVVNIYDFGKLVGSALVDDRGNWGLELSTVLGEGPHSLTANATDRAGNVGPTTEPLLFSVDTVKPLTMAEFTVSDDTGGSAVTLKTGDTTTDSTPTFSGAAGSVKDGATVSIYQGTTLLGTATVAADGSWRFTPDAPLAGGKFEFTTVVTDAAGNQSAASPPFSLTIAPPVTSVTVTSVDDNVDLPSTTLANGASTNDTTPTFNGTGPASGTITVYINGVSAGTVSVDDQGIWHFTPPALADDRYSFTFSADDGATRSEPYILTVDTHAPDAAGEITVIDDLNPEIGQLNSGDLTNDGTPIISGTAEPGSTVRIYDGSSLIGTVLVGDDGQWGFTPTSALGEGSHTITTIVTDAAGNESAASPDFVLVVDTQSPDPVTELLVTDNKAPVVGTITAGDVTNDATPVLSGKAEPGSDIIIYDKGIEIAHTVTDANGHWGLELTTPLSDGPHGLTVVAIDAAGNASQPTAELVFSVDTSAPRAAINITAVDDTGPVQEKLTSGSITDDTTPTFSGSAEPNSTVSIYDGAKLLGQIVVDAGGSWTFTPEMPLSNGQHQFTTVVTDAAGNVSPSSPAFNLTITPVADPISGLVVTDNADPVQGTLANGAATNDVTPTFTGSAAANSTIAVYDNGVLLTTVKADSNGQWSFTPSLALGEGAHSVTFTVDNGSGPSAPSQPFVLTVDTTVPDPVTNLVFVDDRAPVVGQLTNGSMTNDGTPIISGSAEPGATVTLYDGAQVLGSVKVGSDGQWGFTPVTPLGDGVHTITATVTDAAGNVSAPSPEFVLGVDTRAPGPVTLFIATDNEAPNVGTIVSGEATNDNTPIFSGKADPGVQVIIYDGDREIARTTADLNGNWGLELTTPLADGSHSLSAVAVDGAGNTSAPTAAVEITVDTLAPNTVAGLTVTDNVGAVQGPLDNPSQTDDTTPTFSGTAEPGTTVSIYDNGELLGTALVGSDKAWTFTPDAPLSAGPHSIITQVTDAAGNASAFTPPFTLTVAPTVDAITDVTITDNVLPGTGLIANGGTTNDSHAVFSGSLPGATTGTIRVYDQGKLVGTVTLNGETTWSWSPTSALGEGMHSMTFVLEVNNVSSEPSQPYVIYVDTAAPDPVGNLSIVDDASPGIGQLQSGGSTNDPTPIISGTAEPGTTVTIKDNGNVIGTVTVGEDGQWGFIPNALGEGSHAITTIVSDAAGNQSAESPAFNLNVDTGAPATIDALEVSDDREPGVGVLNDGDTTNDNTPTLTGKAENNATVTIYDGNTVLGTVQANGSGDWSFTPTLPLGDGQHSLSATVTDAAGNISAKSPAFTLTIDTTPPTPVSGIIISADSGDVAPGGSTNDTTLTVRGNSEPFSTVNIYDTNGTTVLGTVQADKDGEWSVAIAALTEGPHSITAKATDAMGNVSAASQPSVVVIDLTPPAPISAIIVTDNQLPTLGTVGANGSTNDQQPTLSGRAEANSIINIYHTDANGTTLIATTKADADGNWKTTPTFLLGDKQYSLTATATDAAGNVSTASPATIFTVDTNAPSAMTGVILQNNGVTLADGDTINNASPTLSGVGEKGATIVVYDTDGTTVLGTTIAGPDGTWSLNLPVLEEGPHTLTAKAVDAAGNSSGSSNAIAVTIDTLPPEKISGITVTDSQGVLTSGMAINETLPTLSGKAEPNTIINVYNGATLIATGKADSNGDWSFAPNVPPTPSLKDGNYSLTATATDEAGNVSVASPPFVFTVDTVAPDVSTALFITDNVAPVIGNVPNGGSTNDTTPTFSGKVEPGAKVEVYSGSAPDLVLLTTVTAGNDGSWSYTPAPLDQGEYSITVTVTDAAGNTSTAATDFVIEVDTNAPTSAPTFTVTDDADPVKQIVQSGQNINDATPTLNGFAEPGSTVTIYNGKAVLGTAQASKVDGSWSFTPTSDLKDGDYHLTATATDAAGNIGPASPVFDITIDTTAPANVTNMTVSDDISPVTGLLASGDSTNDKNPTFSGNAEAGAVVIISSDNNGVITELGRVTADNNGVWAFTPTLTDGDYSITTTVVDKAGNTSGPSEAFELTVDTIKPVKVTTIVVADDVLPVTTNVANGGTTNDSTPIISGTAEGNSKVLLFDNGKWVATVTANNDGDWSYPVTTPLTEGTHRYTTIVEDAAGNQSALSDPFVIIVDTVAPVAPGAIVATDNVGLYEGTIPVGGLTNDKTPTLSGVAEGNTLVTVYQDGNPVYSVQTGADGKWSYTTAELTDAQHTFSVTATDAAGNVSQHSPDLVLNIDTQKPATMGVVTVSETLAVGSGPVDAGGYTKDTTPTFSGTAEKGSLITIYDGATPLGTTTASTVDGSWSFTYPSALDQREYVITATATDAAGNESIASPPFSFTVDSVAPNPVTGLTVSDDVTGDIEGELTSGDLTNDNTLTLAGNAEVGSTVKIYNDTTYLGEVTVTDPDGKWTFTTGKLDDGIVNLTTTVTDKAGNVSEPTPDFILRIDATAPATPSTITATDDVAWYEGTISANGLTNDAQPVLSGKAEAFATITIYQGIGSATPTAIDTVVADAAGRWEYTPSTALGNNQYTYYVTATDAAGNTSNPSGNLVFTVDTIAPLAITAIAVTDGLLPLGPTSDLNRPTVRGETLASEAGSTVNIYDKGVLIGSTTIGSLGTWSFTPEAPLADGSHTFTAKIMDAAGNEGGVSVSVALIIDTSVLNGGITGLEVIDNVAPVEGPIANGGYTNDPTPTFRGTAQAGTTINFYDNGSSIGSTVVNGDGTWSFTPTSDLASGSHLITTTVSNGVTTTLPSALFQLTVDTDAPGDVISLVVTDDVLPGAGSISDGGTTNDKTPTFSGSIDSASLEAGGTVIIMEGDKEIGRATLGISGAWSITPSQPLGEGRHDFTITVVDQAGNVSAGKGFSLTVDTAPPAVVNGITLSDDVDPIKGTIAVNGTTNDATPTLNGAAGSAEAGSRVSIYDGSVLLGSVLANADGSWTFTTPVLLNGSHSLTVTATDAAGNVSTATSPIAFTVDTVAPLPILALSVSNDVGTTALISGATTKDSTPIIGGRAEAGSTVTVYNGQTVIGTTTAAADGTWSIAPSSLADKTYTFTATATDAAGNVSQASPPFTLTIDTQAPTAPLAFTVTDNIAPVTGNVTSGTTINDTHPVLTGAAGSVEANALITIYNGNTAIATTRALADGSWSYASLTGWGNAAYALTVTATDAAGNESGKSPIFNLTIDTVAPTAPGGITVYDNYGTIVGNVTNGGVTDDTQPLLSGTAELGSTIKIYDNGVLVDSVVASGPGGSWSYQIVDPLKSGPHSFTVTATDAAGNVSLPSAIFAMNVNTTAPAAILNYTVTDDVSPGVGTLTSGATTNDSLPTISGIGATPNTTVIVLDGGVEIGRGTVNGLGVWSVTPSRALGEGAHSLTLVVVDAAGNTSDATDPFSLNVDTITPQAGALPLVNDNVGTVKGDLTSGALSDDNTPTLRGTVEPNVWVNVYDGSKLLATVKADASGAWSYTPAALADGEHRFSTTVSDAAGNVSGSSPVFILNIDATPPPVAANITLTDNVAPVLEILSNNGSTNDNTPTLNGTAEANATVTIYSGANVLGSVKADGNGLWSYTPSALTDGTYTFSTVVSDAAGNASGRSPDFTITIDTKAPVAIGTLTVTDAVDPVSGTLSNNASSNDTRPVISGTAEKNATITVYDGSKVLGTTTADANGAWSFRPGTELADGAHAFTATATDAAGNIGTASPAFNLTIDTVAPGAITGLTVYDDVAADLGNLTSGSITNDTMPTFSGTAEANSKVAIYDGNNFVTTVTVGSNGQWTWTPTSALSTGAHSFTFNAVDAAGNVGAKTTPFVLTIDPTIGTQVLNAVNDEAGLTLTTSIQQVTATPSSASQSLNVLKLGVGDLLSLNVIQSSQLPTFHVDDGASRALTLQASAVGVTLLSTFDLYIYKSNGDGTYSMYQKVDNFLQVLLLAGTSGTAKLNLPAGDYALLLQADDGLSLLTSSQLKVTSDVTTGVFVDAAGATTTGNVITGVGGGGVDSAPNGTVVSGASGASSSGLTAVAASGSTTIVGTYGTLTINAQGGYTYALKAGVSPSSITGPDVFTYQLKAPNGSTSNATLTIDLNLPNLHANGDKVTLEVDPTPVDVTTAGVSNSSLIVASIGLGSVLGVDVSVRDQLQVDVPVNSTRTFTLSGSVVGVALLSTFDLYIYKLNPATGQYEQSKVYDDWIKVLALVGSKTQSITLDAGHYVFLLKADNGVAVGSVATLATSNDVTHTYQAAVESVTGNVITGAGSASGGADVAPAGTVVTYVNGQAVSATGTTTIVGNYGNLVINAQGGYTYTLRTGQPASGLGQESFTYVIRNGSSVSTSTLTISLPSVGSAASAQSMMATMALVADESVVQTSTAAQTTAQTATLLATSEAVTAQSATLTVDNADALTHSALVLTFSTLPTASGHVAYQILDAQGNLITSGSLTVDGTTLTANVILDNATLHDGQYSVVLQDTAGNTLNSEFSTVLTSVAVTPEASAAGVTVEGQIADIALGTLWDSITLVNEKGQQVTETAGSAQSQTLEGLYGTLTLHADGSYSYSLREGVSVADLTQREQFDYTLKAADGTLSHGSLTIDLHPHVEGSDKADTTVSSAYDDTYTLGGGGDTVIFNLLDSHDATGGNGQHSHWTDFSVSDGDHIDISKLLTDWSGKSEDLGQYLSIEHTASGDTVVSIDRDGAGTQYQSTQLITLEGAQPTLEELLHQDSSANHG
ncbi:MAG: BapA/Bap/LapF family large adhesin [Kluyvera sp.]|uniref:BapA/Bap/LapF family large adhesin n=1 Tax=Kluyvera sp. TaxID=1538228 RepID=UPI003A8BDB75